MSGLRRLLVILLLALMAEPAIVRTGPGDPDGVMNGVIFLGDSFTYGSLIDSLESGFEVIHIASHFEFDPGTVLDSYLVLGDGETLTLAEMRARDVPFDRVDLLTLSACDTAMGSGGDGREIEGMAMLSLNQGAKSVLATLWRVNDDSTALFMERFYRLSTNPGRRSKAEALQQSQLEMLHGRPSKTGAKVGLFERRYRHPYFWAPFVLIGNQR